MALETKTAVNPGKRPRRKKPDAQEQKPTPVETLTMLADELLTFDGILQTIGETFLQHIDRLTEQLRPETKKERQESETNYRKIVDALPTQELREAMGELSNQHSAQIGDAETVFLAIGIALGMKLASASEDEISKTYDMLEIYDRSEEGESR
jgi:hypothetical protein